MTVLICCGGTCMTWILVINLLLALLLKRFYFKGEKVAQRFYSTLETGVIFESEANIIVPDVIFLKKLLRQNILTRHVCVVSKINFLTHFYALSTK